MNTVELAVIVVPRTVERPLRTGGFEIIVVAR